MGRAGWRAARAAASSTEGCGQGFRARELSIHRGAQREWHGHRRGARYDGARRTAGQSGWTVEIGEDERHALTRAADDARPDRSRDGPAGTPTGLGNRAAPV